MEERICKEVSATDPECAVREQLTVLSSIKRLVDINESVHNGVVDVGPSQTRGLPRRGGKSGRKRGGDKSSASLGRGREEASFRRAGSAGGQSQLPGRSQPRAQTYLRRAQQRRVTPHPSPRSTPSFVWQRTSTSLRRRPYPAHRPRRLLLPLPLSRVSAPARLGALERHTSPHELGRSRRPGRRWARSTA